MYGKDAKRCEIVDCVWSIRLRRAVRLCSCDMLYEEREPTTRMVRLPMML